MFCRSLLHRLLASVMSALKKLRAGSPWWGTPSEVYAQVGEEQGLEEVSLSPLNSCVHSNHVEEGTAGERQPSEPEDEDVASTCDTTLKP